VSVICHPVAGIVLNFGLKGIDEPVEAAYQQRHMLMGREETHVFTTFQVGSAVVRLAPRDVEHLVVLGLIIFVFTDRLHRRVSHVLVQWWHSERDALNVQAG
jgi:hypothetical protein